jgi:hypothetical protein
MILDLRDRWKGYLHDLAVRDLDLYAGSGERLGGFHAPNCASHAPAVDRDNLHIVLAIKWLQSRECLGDLHDSFLPEAVLNYDSDIALYGIGSLSAATHATGKHYLAYRNCPCILWLNSNDR